MERLWSFLRRFSRMTKEMRPAHRTDVLTSALVFYGVRTKEKLGTLKGIDTSHPHCVKSIKLALIPTPPLKGLQKLVMHVYHADHVYILAVV